MSTLLAHRVDGAGDPVLLLNGGMMTIGSWDHAAARLQASRRVIRCDFRGQLLSPGPPFHADLSGHVADVVALLDALASPRAHVIGTSFGAEVGLLLASCHPDRVASLVAATATDWNSPDTMHAAPALVEACHAAVAGGNRYAMYDLLLPLTYSPAYLDANAAMLAARREMVARLPNSWFQGTASIVGALEHLDLRACLRDIVCPTLVMIAEHDRIMPRERSHALVSAIAGAQEALVPGSGHGLVVEQPEEFLRLSLEFLDAQAPLSTWSTPRCS